jgi:hypothetical protein
MFHKPTFRVLKRPTQGGLEQISTESKQQKSVLLSPIFFHN